MSPFKGQGANQSLADGLTIAKWLTQASPEAAVKVCMREMVARTAPVVLASREAARFWHSPAAMTAEQKFASVPSYKVDDFLKILKAEGVTAETSNLDERVAQVLKESQHIF